MVLDTDQSPEEIDGEEGNGQRNEPHSLHSTGEVKVIYGTTKAEPARDGGQRRDEQKTHHVTKQCALLLPKTGVLQPLQRQGLKQSASNVREQITET